MTQIDTIIAKIEQLKEELKDLPSGDYKDGVFYVLEEELIPFINSLPAEPSKDLKEAAEEYSGKSAHPLNNAFIAGAQWQKEQTINKASK